MRFCPVVILLVLAMTASGAIASDGLIPSMTVSLDPSDQDVEVASNHTTTTVQFDGVVTVSETPLTSMSVQLVGVVDNGWMAACEPSSIDFRGSGTQQFTCSVLIPYINSSENATLTVTAKGTTRVLIVTAVTQASIRVEYQGHTNASQKKSTTTGNAGGNNLAGGDLLAIGGVAAVVAVALGTIGFMYMRNRNFATSLASRAPSLSLAVTVFGLLAVIVIGASMASPWYSTELTVNYQSISMYSGTTFTLQGMNTKVTSMNISTSASKPWSDSTGVDHTKALYGQTFALDILGLVMNAMLMICGVLLMRKKKRIGLMIALLAFLFALLAPFLFMGQHAGAMAADQQSGGTSTSNTSGPHKSFSGYTNIMNIAKLTWGPGIGWTLALAGAIFSFLGFVFALLLNLPGALPDQAPVSLAQGAPGPQPDIAATPQAPGEPAATGNSPPAASEKAAAPPTG